jgi:hypothetical protein
MQKINMGRKKTKPSKDASKLASNKDKKKVKQVKAAKMDSSSKKALA